MYLGSPPDNELCRTTGLDSLKSVTGRGEDYRGVLRDINGGSPFAQPPLKVAKGYDSRWLTNSIDLRDVSMITVSSG